MNRMSAARRRQKDRHRKRMWYLTHREEKAALNRAYYEANRERIIEQDRLRRAARREAQEA